MAEKVEPAVADLFRDVYHAAGHCLAVAQALEFDLKFLLWVLASAHVIAIPLESAVAMMEGQDKQTLGQLLRTVQKHVPFSAQDEVVLKKALSTRNAFIHGYLSDHAEQLVSPDGRAGMIAEVKAMRRAIAEGEKVVRRLIDELLNSFGFDPSAAQTGLLDEMRRLSVAASDGDVPARDA
jgi:hypothetical protein